MRQMGSVLAQGESLACIDSFNIGITQSLTVYLVPEDVCFSMSALMMDSR